MYVLEDAGDHLQLFGIHSGEFSALPHKRQKRTLFQLKRQRPFLATSQTSGLKVWKLKVVCCYHQIEWFLNLWFHFLHLMSSRLPQLGNFGFSYCCMCIYHDTFFHGLWALNLNECNFDKQWFQQFKLLVQPERSQKNPDSTTDKNTVCTA